MITTYKAWNWWWHCKLGDFWWWCFFSINIYITMCLVIFVNSIPWRGLRFHLMIRRWFCFVCSICAFVYILYNFIQLLIIDIWYLYLSFVFKNQVRWLITVCFLYSFNDFLGRLYLPTKKKLLCSWFKFSCALNVQRD